MRTATITVAIVVALALALTACGGGPPDPVKVYADAGEKMAALASYHIRLDFQEEDESSVGEIDLVPPDTFQATFSSRGGWETTLMGIGDQFYAKFPGFSPHWFVYSEQAIGWPAPQIAAFNAALLTQITDLTYVGEEAVDGVSTYRLQGSLAPEVVALIDAEDAPTEAVTVDLWVGVEDSLVRRYQLVEPDGAAILYISRFGESVAIVAPADPHPAEELARYMGSPQLETPDQVKEAIAGLSAGEQDCLRRALGDAAFAELKGGTRLPTQEEFQQGEECVAR